ncbi:MAG: hypothetical protein M1284_02535 [Candidatus Parvarchaeota archaeon]|jgi:hypothetical protein|nr:hypothetical protein [Candidatus Parvarchaeota archaeon]
MERNFLERIVKTIKLVDGAGYSEETAKKLNVMYSKYGTGAVLDLANKMLEERADNILTRYNLKTVNDTAKVLTYLELYNEIKEKRSFYESRENGITRRLI